MIKFPSQNGIMGPINMIDMILLPQLTDPLNVKPNKGKNICLYWVYFFG